MKSERGQALILIALGIAALLALTALAIDGGIAFAERRSAQNAVDNAALSAGYRLAAGGTMAEAVESATLIANQNGFSDVTVNIPPQSGQYAGNEEYVEVILQTSTDATFGVVVGVEQVDSSVRAVARGRSSIAGKLAHGNAIVALNPNKQHSVKFNGGAHVTATGGGVFVNSAHNQAMMFNSNITVDVPGMTIVGGYQTNANFSWLDTIQTGQTSQQIPLPPVSLTAQIPAIPAAPTCSSNGSSSKIGNNEVTFTPGQYGNITIDGVAKFQPGVYCLNGNLNINGGGSIVGMPGTIKFVLGKSMNWGGSQNAVFDNLEIYTHNSDLSVQINKGSLLANRFRFYATGNGGLTVNANSGVEANDAFLYFAKGDYKWNGQSTITLKAPPQGDPFAGLLVYLPWENTSKVNLNGGSKINIVGTVMMPNVELTVNGGANMNAVNSQIIAHDITFNGGGHVNVVYNADDNFSPAQLPMVELTE